MGWEPVECRIPHLLHKLGKSQRWFADQVGETEQHVSNYVTMKRLPGLKKARKYARVLKCHIDDLHVWKFVDQTASDE